LSNHTDTQPLKRYKGNAVYIRC